MGYLTAGVSIHAPARGATCGAHSCWTPDRCFNPRARTGRDSSGNEIGYILAAVSIHAPARGATRASQRSNGSCWFQSTRPHGARPSEIAADAVVAGFQSTRPHGARPATVFDGSDLITFQSTRPHGARPWPWPFLNGCVGFNPRARTGRDSAGEPTRQRAFVSIHAPARGATVRGLCRCDRGRVSIHAPARGATLTGVRTASTRPSFNPRARTGRDFGTCKARSGRPVSIHAPARGATRIVGRELQRRLVSIHAPARGATRRTAFRRKRFWRFNPRARTGRDSVILPTRISTPIVGPIAIPSHDLLISPITPIQVRKFLMITRCWRRANRQRKTRSLQVRGSKNQGTL